MDLGKEEEELIEEVMGENKKRFWVPFRGFTTEV